MFFLEVPAVVNMAHYTCIAFVSSVLWSDYFFQRCKTISFRWCKTIFFQRGKLFSVEMENRPNSGNEDCKEKSTYPRHRSPGGRPFMLHIFESFELQHIYYSSLHIFEIFLSANSRFSLHMFECPFLCIFKKVFLCACSSFLYKYFKGFSLSPLFNHN